MKQVDLHVHSTYSDGTNTPSELIAIASSKNLSAIALTDHDTLDGDVYKSQFQTTFLRSSLTSFL